MQMTGILDDYESIADSMLQLLQEERARLRTGDTAVRIPALESKRLMIDQLGAAIAEIRRFQQSATEEVSHLRGRIERIQQKLIKVLQLDREVEKLFLARSMRPDLPPMVPAAGFVGNAYRRAMA